MKRRHFLKTSALWAGGAALAQPVLVSPAAAAGMRFRLNYAPHFGMFKYSAGGDPVEQLKFAAERGFTAWEDKGLRGRPVELQERIAEALRALGMQMGAFVATASFHEVTFARSTASVREQVLSEIRDSIKVARRVDARWLRVVPGHCDSSLSWNQQTANCVELLKQCCGLLEPYGLVILLEPIPWGVAPRGCLVHSVSQACQLCRAVRSPACKVVFDVYQQQSSGADLIAQIDEAWSEVGYFQCGDGPGRKEPGTGRVPYRDVFRYLYGRGYQGLLGMEHGHSLPGAAGELAVIEAYRSAEAGLCGGCLI